MKRLLFILLLASCAPKELVVSTPPGKFTITEFAPDGSTRAVYVATSYTETSFPASVTFRDMRGRSVKIKGSYLVERE